MKKACVFMFAVVAAATLSAATINQVIVRQQWPWSIKIKVEYSLSGVDASHPVDIAVTTYNGDDPLPSTNLREAIEGNLYGITEEFGEFYIDPVIAYGTEKIGMTKFKVKLAVADSPANIGETLYKIFDLTNGGCTDVTRRDLLNGKYGAVETDFSKIGDGFSTTLADVIIWTGVTNYPGTRTTKLVMRKIPAKGVTYSMGDSSCGGPVDVSFTRDYWMGVFEVTQTQMSYMRSSQTFTEVIDAAERAASTVSWNQARGVSSHDSNYPKVGVFEDHDKSSMNSGSALYGLQALLGVSGFDLPTEAQWEFACRAGTAANVLNSGKANNQNNFAEVGRAQGINCSGSGWATAETGLGYGANIPGQYKPNAFGLYDMHGNVMEHCLDMVPSDVNNLAAVTTALPGGNDPRSTGDNTRRAARGGDYRSSYGVGISYYRIATNPGWDTACYGLRICLNEAE